MLIVYALLYYIENRLTNTPELLSRAAQFGPVVGALAGSIPQCGFSAAASALFSAGFLAPATLVAVFLATSDEAVPIMLAGGASVQQVVLLLVVKFAIAVIGGYHGPDPDVMRTRIGDGGTLNYGKYHNDRIEEIFAEAQTEPDQAKRTELYYEMQKIMSEELPVMPLTEWCYILVMPDNFSGHYMVEKETVGSSDYRTLKIN